MALTSVNPVEEKEKKSALEKFAQGLDIAQGVANVGVGVGTLANMGSKGGMSGMQAYLKKKKGMFDMGSVG